MRIVGVGGGPAALYFGILMKRAFPGVSITLHERNRSGDTFGWGVVFSDETLDHFREADPESHKAIRESFVDWTDIETYVGGACVRSTGHGFSGLARKRLLEILQDRCRALGVTIRFEHEIGSLGEVGSADLVLGADGVNSVVREAHAAHFRPQIDWGRCRFSWLGTDKPLRAFTFVFRENEHGWFQAHAYPFAKGLGTWIVECREETWKRAGLDAADESRTLAYCQKLFAEDLGGHRLLANRSIWRRFPTVSNATWHHENIVLLGDAAHTAHFSIGSGTKLAMEDAIALVEAFREHGLDSISRVLRHYEERRRAPVSRLQAAARTSLQWFEHASRFRGQTPALFTFNLLTRSQRITYDKLRARDPALVRRADEDFAESSPAGATSAGPRDRSTPPPADRGAPPPVFAPLRLRDVTLPNRLVVSPMCQYAAVEGVPGDWHLVHLGSRAVGGAGLVLAEMTSVERAGRITRACAGLWEDTQIPPWKRIVAFVHEHTTSRIGIQLGHAGRKGSCALPWEGGEPLPAGEGWRTIAPSALPFAPGWPPPEAMNPQDLRRIVAAFRDAARRADLAGFDLVELHMAHGYLLSSFLSPLSNHREDAWGGGLEGRLRFPLEVVDAVRGVWPAEKPLAARISATDWRDEEGGLQPGDAVEIARALRDHGCDLLDVSSGGVVPESIPPRERLVQVPLAERIRWEADVPVCAVGGIRGADEANTILAAGRADLCAIARAHLRRPYLTLEAIADYGRDEQPWPVRYLAARPRR